MRLVRLAASAFAFSLTLSAASAQSQTQPKQEPAPIPLSAEPQTQTAPDSRADKELRADILMARKMYSEACEVYLDLLQDDPKNPTLLNRVGISYHQRGELGRARKYYERAKAADPAYAYAINNIGSTDYDRKKYRGAEKWFKRAIEADPAVAAFHANLAHAYFQREKYDDAILQFREAILLDPQIFEHRGQFGTVLQHLTVTDRPAYFFFLAKTFATLGDPVKCAEYLLKARDEGYTGLAAVNTDPAFAQVRNHPSIQQIVKPNSVGTSSANRPVPR